MTKRERTYLSLKKKGISSRTVHYNKRDRYWWNNQKPLPEGWPANFAMSIPIKAYPKEYFMTNGDDLIETHKWELNDQGLFKILNDGDSEGKGNKPNA